MNPPGAPVSKRGTVGQRLIDRGAITPDQLDRAIEAQVIFGGRIGTSLLELGFVDEKTLNAVLSEQLGIPTLEEGVTDPSPSYETLQLISPELAGAYRVLPLRTEGKRLHLLIEDPSNLQQLDDLAFRTGYIIKPCVVAEARLAFLLERYYGIRRDTRYMHLSADGSEIRRAAADGTGDAAAAPAGREETHWDFDDGWGRGREKPADRTPPPGDDLLPEDLHMALMGNVNDDPGAAWQDSEKPPAQSERAPAAPQTATPQTAMPQTATPRSILTVEDARARLAAVEARDEVAQALLDFSRGRCRRAALFIYQRGAFIGWTGAGEGVETGAVKALRFSADVPSALRAACEAGSHLVCAMSGGADSTVHASLFAALGGGAATTALLIPISVGNRIVNVFYADNGAGGEPPRDVGAFLEVTGAVPSAFARLLRKRKAMVS
ncbi:MAG: hypothetical protein ACE5FC_00635 [Myxococcota bacterium]